MAWLRRFKPPTLFLIASGIAGCLLAGLLAYLYFDIVDRSRNIINVKGDLRSRLIAINSLSLIRQEYETVKSYLPQVDKLLPSQDDLLNFPNDVGALAKNHGAEAAISFRSNPSPGTSSSTLQPTNFFLTAQGPLDGIFATLNDLNAGRYIVKFVSFDFIRQGDGFRATLNGRVFSR